jgi:hypothetical protein
MNPLVPHHPVPLQRIEGAFMLAVALWLYDSVGQGWWFFLLLLFVPDASMVGYLRSTRVGAVVYNIGHSLAVPLALLLIGWSFAIPVAQAVALVWVAHIGMDRALGYGLKHDGSFHDTHLGRIGRGRAERAPGRAAP